MSWASKGNFLYDRLDFSKKESMALAPAPLTLCSRSHSNHSMHAKHAFTETSTPHTPAMSTPIVLKVPFCQYIEVELELLEGETPEQALDKMSVADFMEAMVNIPYADAYRAYSKALLSGKYVIKKAPPEGS